MADPTTSSTLPISPVAELPRPLAVVCHDAGAANIILSWLAAEQRSEVRPFMAGPALRLWTERFPAVPAGDSLEAALDGAAGLVSGTGWASDLEHRARLLAQNRRIRSVAVVDHWVNYRARFERAGQFLLPDEVWVTDEDAEREAARSLPDVTVRQKPNFYLAEQIARIPPPIDSMPPRLLYVLEPARSEWGRGRPGEFQALDYFINHLAAVGLPRNTEIRLRPHPSDPPGKYDGWLVRYPEHDLRIDALTDMATALANVQWVAGCQSYAMVLGLAAERRVICTLPPWAPESALPHKGFITLAKRVSGGEISTAP